MGWQKQVQLGFSTNSKKRVANMFRKVFVVRTGGKDRG